MKKERSTQREQEIFTEQVKLLYQQTKSEIKSNPIPPIIISLILYQYVNHNTIIAWLILIEVAIFIKAYLLFRFNKYTTEKKIDWVIYITIFNTLHCLLGGILFLYIDLQENYFIAIIYSGVLIILSSIMAHILASMQYLYLFPCLSIHIPVAIKSFLEGSPAFILLGIAYLTGCIQFLSLNRNIYKTILESIMLRFEKNDLIQELEQKRQDAEQANLLKTKFLAAASHDLRQPLHSMSLFLEILHDKLNTREQQELIKKINTSNESLTTMLNTLLDISKMDANTIEVNKTNFQINTLFASLISDFTPLANQKNIDLQLDIPDKTIVNSDIFHIDRILRNLLSNAIKYSDHGKVILSCKKNDENSYTISVSDNGRGIPLEQQELIFNEFYQLHNPERDRRQGLGLGLSIVRRLCHFLGSDIQLTSMENQGTTFFFSIAKGDDTIVESNLFIQRQTRLSQLKLLVIDDEPEILQAMELLATGWGATVKIADSAEEARKLLLDSDYKPEIIISDYRLRDNKTGIEAIYSLRSVLNNEDIPAIILTGDTTPDVIGQCREDGFLLLYKPIKPAKLLETLSYFYKKSQKNSSAQYSG